MADKIYKTVLFITLAAVLIFSPLARGAVRLWSAAPVFLALYAMIFLWLLRVVNSKNGDSPHRRENNGPGTVPVLLFAILAASSFAFSIYKHGSFCALLRLFAYIGLYFIVVREFDHTARRRIIWLVISMGGILSLYGLLQYFGVFSHSWWMPKRFLAAAYVNHNHFAGYLELAIPVAAAVLTARSTRRSIFFRIALVAALVCMFAAFVLTQSRGAWVSLGFSLLVMLLAMVWRVRSAARIMAIAVLAIAAIVSLVYFTGDMMSSRLATITAADPDEDVSGGRFKIWQGAVGMIKERPLVGMGIGDFDHGFYRYRPLGLNVRAVYAHNDYLHMAAEMGIFAPLLMIWLFAVVVREGFGKRERSPYAFGCAIGVMSLALHGIVDFNFHIPANMILFTLWMGTVIGE